MNERIKAIEPYGVTFYENRERPLNVRMAMASREAAKYCSVWIDAKNYIGYTASGCQTSAMTYTFGSGIAVNDSKFEENKGKFLELADELAKIQEYVRDFNTGSLIGAHQDRYQKELASTSACWGGGWAGHSNPDYDRLLHLGTKGIRELIAKYRTVNAGKDDFYDGCDIFMDALDILGKRLRECALNMAENTDDPAAKSEFEKMAEVYSVIPKNPAYNMQSAILMFWLVDPYNGIPKDCR